MVTTTSNDGVSAAEKRKMNNNPEISANVVSRFTFWWMNALVKHGSTHTLEMVCYTKCLRYKTPSVHYNQQPQHQCSHSSAYANNTPTHNISHKFTTTEHAQKTLSSSLLHSLLTAQSLFTHTLTYYHCITLRLIQHNHNH